MAGPFDSQYDSIRERIIYYANLYGIDSDVAIWQLWQENRFRSSGCSGAGACGIAQFIPASVASQLNRRYFDCAAIVPPPLKVIVGAGSTRQEGWVSLQQNDLDIREARSWQRLMNAGTVDAILSEHVLEHLDIEEATAAAKNMWIYLKCGGRWRIAVPDGFHPCPNYLNWVAPNSGGERFLKIFRQPNEPDHKWLWNYQTLVSFLSRHGFRVVLLEYFDRKGLFHKNNWNPEKGNIWRCAGSGWSNLLSLVVNAPYTSLIVDAIKICS